jgi:hypothetical protein
MIYCIKLIVKALTRCTINWCARWKKPFGWNRALEQRNPLSGKTEKGAFVIADSYGKRFTGKK